MKPAAFSYERAASLASALALLNGSDRFAQALAGGQSLIALLNLRLAAPELLVDLRGIPELNVAEETPSAVFLGAATTHSAIEDGKVPDPSRGLMKVVASGIAYRAIRNRGTIGGSVALADPAADWPSCLVALDAVAVVAGPQGKRRTSVEALIEGAYATTLDAGEIILGFEIPRLGDRASWGRAKVARKSGAYADSIALTVCDPQRARMSVVLAGADSRPRVLPAAEAWLRERSAGAAVSGLDDAVKADLAALPIEDPYLRRCHHATVVRAVLQAVS